MRRLRRAWAWLRAPLPARYVMSWERVEQERWDKDVDRLLLFVQPIGITFLLVLAWIEAHDGRLGDFLMSCVLCGGVTWLWLRIARRRLR